MNKHIIFVLILIFNNSSFASNKVSNLISPVSYFINHIKQFQLLDNNLKKHKNASLVGVSGIGKTQLARMYAYESEPPRGKPHGIKSASRVQTMFAMCNHGLLHPRGKPRGFAFA